MKHISLFSGIGGFDLAAEWMGWENVAHCEWNPFGQRILKYYWPNAISYEDITKTDFTIHRGTIDIVSGGFPCQPYSSAGKRKGKEDERHLWPEMLRAIREIQPTWVVGENVRGLTNWDGGLVFHEVQADLEAEGYEVTPFLLPASGVNAPHERYRIWFIAYANGSKQIDNKRKDRRKTEEIRRETPSDVSTEFCSNGIIANTNNKGLQRSENIGITTESRQNGNKFFAGLFPSDFSEFPTKPPIRNGNDGLPSELDGITISKWIDESIKSGGNAIVPQLALQIFKAIQQYELIINSGSRKAKE